MLPSLKLQLVNPESSRGYFNSIRPQPRPRRRNSPPHRPPPLVSSRSYSGEQVMVGKASGRPWQPRLRLSLRHRHCHLKSNSPENSPGCFKALWPSPPNPR
jgi:hypothetical protein